MERFPAAYLNTAPGERPEFFPPVSTSQYMTRDISVFGDYTYLVTELFWGLVAALLLRRSGSEKRAARTILALYPIGYLWDRYTLDVGVFEIPLRTGVDVAGIPIEEHLFMLVVPSMVIGAHETLCDFFGR
jgi:lycopene cyclase domain-containing protein